MNQLEIFLNDKTNYFYTSNTCTKYGSMKLYAYSKDYIHHNGISEIPG